MKRGWGGVLKEGKGEERTDREESDEGKGRWGAGEREMGVEGRLGRRREGKGKLGNGEGDRGVGRGREGAGKKAMREAWRKREELEGKDGEKKEGRKWKKG